LKLKNLKYRSKKSLVKWTSQLLKRYMRKLMRSLSLKKHMRNKLMLNRRRLIKKRRLRMNLRFKRQMKKFKRNRFLNKMKNKKHKRRLIKKRSLVKYSIMQKIPNQKFLRLLMTMKKKKKKNQ
jgi:hypothetical protein